ncbi:MAG: S8 family peptidase, partial [Bacteriovorax sp.]
MKLTALLSFVAFSTMAFGADSLVVNDPLYSKQWALKNNGQVILKNISDLERVRNPGIPGNDINWVDTSAIATSKKDLIVAVLDSGVDIDHPDLKDRIWYNDKLCTNAPNAKNLPCNGFNFLDGNNNLSDDVGHGTHVAGVIAANRNNIGIAGAADPRIKIMPVKVLNSQVSGFVYNGKLITDVIADAMVFAIKNGAEVINLSLGWPKLIDTPKIRQAFQMAEDQNVMVIAASGNNTKDLPTFPCAYENVVCVGAIDNRGELADFSNYGSKVDLVAPGEYIVSTIPRNLESRVLRI